MPTQTEPEKTSQGEAVSRLTGKMSLAEALSEMDEPTGDTTPADKAQSKTTGEVGDGDNDEVETDAGDEGNDEDDSSDEDTEETEDGEDEEAGDETPEGDQGDDDVELPEESVKIIQQIEKSNPELAQTLRKDLIETENLRLKAESVLMAENAFLNIVEVVSKPETVNEGLAEIHEWIAKKHSISVPELLSRSGIQVTTGTVPEPDFLSEAKIDGFIAEALKAADLDDGAQKQDATLGAEIALKKVLERMGELLPADYHTWKQEREQKLVQDKAKAEAAKVAKSVHAKVASNIARRFAGYALTIEQTSEALEAFPMLAKDAESATKAVIAQFDQKLVGFVQKSKTKREKRQMPLTPSGDNRPKARTNTFKPGMQKGMKLSDALG